MANFRHKVLAWDDAVVPMKEPGIFLGKPNPTKLNMREVVMKKSDLDSTREATEQVVKGLDSTYDKYNSDKVAKNAV